MQAAAPPTNVLPTARCGVDVGTAKVAEMQWAYQSLASSERDVKEVAQVDAAQSRELKLLLLSAR